MKKIFLAITLLLAPVVQAQTTYTWNVNITRPAQMEDSSGAMVALPTTMQIVYIAYDASSDVQQFSTFSTVVSRALPSTVRCIYFKAGFYNAEGNTVIADSLSPETNELCQRTTTPTEPAPTPRRVGSFTIEHR